MWAAIIVQYNDAILSTFLNVLMASFNFCRVSTYRCALIVVLCSRKSMSSRPLLSKKTSSLLSPRHQLACTVLDFFGVCMYVGEWIHVLPLLAQTLAFRLEMMAPCFISRDKTGLVMIFFIVIPFQELQWCWHSVQHLLFCKANGSSLHTDLQELQMFCQGDVNGTVTNSQHKPNVFYRPPSVFFDGSIHRSNDIMSMSWPTAVFQ